MRKIILYVCLLLTSLSLAAHERFIPPTVPTTNVTFSSIEGSSMRINWTNGNGARRIVVVRQGSAVTAVPADGVDYNASSVFGNGDAIQPGQFVVYDNNVNSLADVSGLQPNTTYYVAIYEYNGTGVTTEYLTGGAPSASQATLTNPLIPASNIDFSNLNGNSMTITWTNGSGTRRMVLLREGAAVNANPVDLSQYNSNTVFGSGSQIGTGNYVMFAGTGNTVNITNLLPGTTYHVSVIEYNGVLQPVYLVASPAISSQATLPRPTIAASNVTFSSIEGTSMRVNWNNGNGIRRIVVAREGSAVTAVPADGVAYTANSVFGNGDAIQPGEFVVYNSNINSLADVSGLQPNTTYFFRVYEYSGSGTITGYLTASFASGSQSTVSAPTTPASNITFTNITGNAMTINWTNGNGGQRLILMKEGSAVDASPVNFTIYNPNPVFGSGTQLGTGNYVIYRSSTGNSVNITNLQPGTTYHVAAYELNGNTAPVYAATATTASQATGLRPTVAASAVNFSSIEGGAMRINWTNGNGSRRIVVARQGNPVTAVPVDGINYTAAATFGSGDAIQPGEFVIYNSNINSLADVNGLQPNTTYHFRIYEYSGVGTNIAYLTSSFASGSQATLSAPTTPPSNVTFSNITGNSMTVSWTNGNGSQRLVLMKQGSAVDANPVNLSTYTGNSTFGSGTQIGTGNYAIFRSGSGNSVTVTNLQQGVTYHVAVYEINGNTSPVYNTAVPAIASQATGLRPTVAASNITFSSIEGASMRVNWVSGNGTRRIVVGRQGSPVTAIPVDGIDYTANPTFGNGSAIQPGEFVLYNSNVNTLVDINGLQPNSIYYFRIYEYSGTGATTAYLTSAFASANQSTVTAPLVQASTISLSAVTGNSITVGWTVGDGGQRLVLARAGSAVNTDPVDLSVYNANAIFSSGTQVGTGNYSVYRSNGTSVTVTGLTPGTTYHFTVYEFNGNSGPVYLRPGLAGSSTTLGPPQVQSANAATGNLTASSMQLNWTNGSGNRRLVLMKANTAVNAVPVDNGTYTANTFFGSGTQIGTANYVVYDGVGSSVTVTGLAANTAYHFAVFEYNAFGVNSQFLLTNPAAGNATTNMALPVTFLGFTASGTTSGIQLNWSTAQEQNSLHFEVQKSNDGRVFTTAGTVQAAGESVTRKDYSWTDANPFAGLNYYRLRQVDKDNRFMYSTIISLSWQPVQLVKKIVNPIHQSLVIELHPFNRNNASRNEWYLYDLQGKRIAGGLITGSRIQHGTTSLKNGLYILQIIVNNNPQQIKIMKL